MAKRQPVFEVFVASRVDEKLRNRAVHGGQTYIATYKLPLRRRYLIEARGMRTAEKKALNMAAADGVPGAIVKGILRLGIDGPSTDIFKNLMGVDD